MDYAWNQLHCLLDDIKRRVQDWGTIISEMERYERDPAEARSAITTSTKDPEDYLMQYAIRLHSIPSLIALSEHYLQQLFKTAMYARYYTRRGRFCVIPTDEQIQNRMTCMFAILRNNITDIPTADFFEENMHAIVDVFCWLLNQERCRGHLPWYPPQNLQFPDWFTGNAVTPAEPQQHQCFYTTQEGGEEPYTTPRTEATTNDYQRTE